MTDADRNFALKIAAKLLEIATLASPYPTVSSPTPYDVPFSPTDRHNLVP